MLRKLLHYDLQAMLQALLPVWLVAWAGTLACLLISYMPVHWLSTRILAILMVLCLLVSCAALLYALLLGWQQFLKQIFLDPAYLRRTLPVSLPAISASLVLSALLSIAAAALLLLLQVLAFIEFSGPSSILTAALPLGEGMTISIKDLLHQGLFSEQLWFACKLFFVGGLQASYIYVCGLFGLCLAQKKKHGALLWATIYGLLMYAVMPIVVVGLLLLYQHLQPAVFQTDPDLHLLNQILLAGALLYGILDALIIGWIQKLMVRNVDVQ